MDGLNRYTVVSLEVMTAIIAHGGAANPRKIIEQTFQITEMYLNDLLGKEESLHRSAQEHAATVALGELEKQIREKLDELKEKARHMNPETHMSPTSERLAAGESLDSVLENPEAPPEASKESDGDPGA